MANIILARLLTPEDFGLMGTVAVALAAVDAVTFFASNQAIIQNDRGRDSAFLHTAFWIACVRGVVLGLFLLAAAPFAAGYFNCETAKPLFYCVALQPLIVGLASPREQVLVKDMKFASWSIFRFAGSVIGLFVTIVLAVWLRSAWALLLGQLLTMLIFTLGSYIVAPYCPRLMFDVDSWRQLRKYGLRAFGTPVFIALILQAPALMLGKISGTIVLGIFIMNQRLAWIPRDLFMRVVMTVAMPAYSARKNDTTVLIDMWLNALRAVGLIMLPAAAVFHWLDYAMPQVVYGPTFEATHGVFGILAIEGALECVGVVTGPVFWSVGAPHNDRKVQMLRCAIVYGLGYVLMRLYSTWGFAVGLLVASVSAQIFMLGLAVRLLGAEWKRVSHALALPIVVAVCLRAILGVIGVCISFGAVGRVVVGILALLVACIACIPSLRAAGGFQRTLATH